MARRAAEAFGKYQSDRPTYFGVFFDPLAHDGVMTPPISGLTPAQKQLANNESERAGKVEEDADAKDKLRRQVRHQRLLPLRPLC